MHQRERVCWNCKLRWIANVLWLQNFIHRETRTLFWLPYETMEGVTLPTKTIPQSIHTPLPAAPSPTTWLENVLAWHPSLKSIFFLYQMQISIKICIESNLLRGGGAWAWTWDDLNSHLSTHLFPPNSSPVPPSQFAFLTIAYKAT